MHAWLLAQQSQAHIVDLRRTQWPSSPPSAALCSTYLNMTTENVFTNSNIVCELRPLREHAQSSAVLTATLRLRHQNLGVKAVCDSLRTSVSFMSTYTPQGEFVARALSSGTSSWRVVVAVSRYFTATAHVFLALVLRPRW
jgi:hypothetical protein